MAPVPGRYAVRWVAGNARKESRRVGYPVFVIGGEVINPGTVSVSLAVTPSGAVTAGTSLTFTATATGGTGPYSYVFSVVSGPSMMFSGSGNTRTAPAPAAGINPVVRVVVTDALGNVEQDEVTLNITGSTAYPINFAGHVPNRVLVGFASTVTGTPKPTYAEAMTHINTPTVAPARTIYERRRFESTWVSEAGFNSMVSEADAIGALPNISFKVPGGSNGTGWGQVRDGAHDSGLLTLFNLLQAYNKPVIVSFEHEPTGSGIDNAQLLIWAQMHIRCARYFGGWRNGGYSSVKGGTYNPAHDLSLNNGGKVSWGPIGNGFIYEYLSTTHIQEGMRNAKWPQLHIDTLNEFKGIVQNDFYDTVYQNETLGLTDRTYRVPKTGGIRTSTRIRNFMTWARQRGIKAAGCGEFSAIDGAEITECWKVMRDNRDIWGLTNYYNSQIASRCDWTIRPSNYPASSYVGSKGLADLGGDAQSQGRLDAFKNMLDESISPTYTAPI